MLSRYGASRFVSGWDEQQATIMFEAAGRRVRFEIPLPKAEEFLTTPKGQKRQASLAQTAAQTEERRRWRALMLVIKAKLEAVETKITSFEDEFLAHFVLPNGSTVGQWLAPQLEKAYATEKMPPLLPGRSP